MNALADEDMIDQGLDEKDHPIAGAAALREELTGGNYFFRTIWELPELFVYFLID